jgi:tyrosyl-tRNA synthetase
MPEWYRLAGAADPAEVDALVAGLDGGNVHPGEAKRALGRRIVARYHGDQAAAEAETAFDRLFKSREVPDDIPIVALAGDGSQSLPALLADAGLVSSRSESRRLIKQGAVKIDGAKIDTEFLDAGTLRGAVIQVGKRRFVRISDD